MSHRTPGGRHDALFFRHIGVWPRWLLLALTLLPLAAHADDGMANALQLYDERRYTEARAAFRAVEAGRAADPVIDFHLGRIALWFDDTEEALERLQRAAGLAPADGRIQNALGDAYGLAAQQAPLLAKLGWGRKCLAAYERAVAIEPGNPAFHWSLLAYSLFAPRIAGGGLDKAREAAEVIKRLDPTGGYSALVTVHLAAEEFDLALAEIDRALAVTPDDFIALYQLGRWAAISGRQVGRGQAALERCLTLEAPRGDGRPNHALVHYRLGNLLEKQGLAEAARAHYAQTYDRQPDFRADKMTLKN